MLADLDNYLPFLLGLFEARDWTSFENVAFSDPKTYKVISMSICECEEFNRMTLLHACVRYEPPVSVLLKMIELHPQALKKEDCIGRIPLHIAAGSGASSLVMKVLTMKYPEACNIQDEDGRTPLHFACDSSCELFEDDEESSSRGPPSLDTVIILLAGSLDAVILEDADEMNAIEYALLSDAPLEVITLLQKAMQRTMRMKLSKVTSSPSNMTSSPRSCPATSDYHNVEN
jgi:ankyrin repeat protein